MVSRAAVLALLFATNATVMAASIRTLPDLEKVTIYESTFTSVANDYAPDATALTTRLPDQLGDSNNDFSFYPGEYYDVFYSNADGSLDPDGAFVTIEGIWTGNLSLGGGMNIGEVKLTFGGASPQELFGSFVASFVRGSRCDSGSCIDGSEANAVDGNTGTIPRFGGTDPTNASERMRLTIGFAGISPVPEPSAWTLFALGLAGVAGMARRARRSSALG